MRGARSRFSGAIWFALGVGAAVLAMLAMNVASDRGVVRELAGSTVENVYYRNCDAARAEGDADDDGIACEPYRGR
jgi:hypothetical protein